MRHASGTLARKSPLNPHVTRLCNLLRIAVYGDLSNRRACLGHRTGAEPSGGGPNVPLSGSDWCVRSFHGCTTGWRYETEGKMSSLPLLYRPSTRLDGDD
jgi:hypothetical protein